MVAVVMGALAEQQPRYTTNDIVVAVRDGVHEHITMRKFQPHEILFAPETTEVKDVFWTQGRSHVVRNTTRAHPENRHWIVDGKLKSNANTDNKDISFFVQVHSHGKPMRRKYGCTLHKNSYEGACDIAHECGKET